MSDIDTGILARNFPIVAANLRVGQNCSVTFHGSRYLLERTGPGRFDLRAKFIEVLPTPSLPPVRYIVRQCRMLDFPCATLDAWQEQHYESVEEAMRAAQELGSRNGQSEAVYIGWTGGSNNRCATEFAVCRAGRVFGTWGEWRVYEHGQPEA